MNVANDVQLIECGDKKDTGKFINEPFWIWKRIHLNISMHSHKELLDPKTGPVFC